MSGVPIKKSDVATEDMLGVLADTIKAEKIKRIDVKSLINIFRPILEALGITDTLTPDLNLKTLPETITPSDIKTDTVATRYELEAVDGAHPTEVAVKIGFWELNTA